MYCTVKFLINVSNGDETSKKKLGVFETPQKLTNENNDAE